MDSVEFSNSTLYRVRQIENLIRLVQGEIVRHRMMNISVLNYKMKKDFAMDRLYPPKKFIVLNESYTTCLFEVSTAENLRWPNLSYQQCTGDNEQI